MKKPIIIAAAVINLLSLLFIHAHQDHNNSFKENPLLDTIRINDTLYGIKRR